MPKPRFNAVLTAALSLVAAAPATAATVPVLHPDGTVSARVDPGVAARDRTVAPRVGVPAARPAAASTKKRTTLSELARLRDAGAFEETAYAEYRAEYRRDRALARKLKGRRKVELTGALRNVDQMAARGSLTASRLVPLWLQLRRNREWWSNGPLLASGARVSFAGTELVFQYFPGEGLQFHPLANFGKLNYLARPRSDYDRMVRLLDELLPLAARRAGGVAWEHYFDFGGGAPPWVSSLSQGTGLQAMSRAAVRAGTDDVVLPVLRQGLTIFQRRTPSGVRVPAGAGNHYAQYSYAPGLRILNGFVQSLNGLHDFARLAEDPTAQALFDAGEARARREVPTYDTGFWSLYDRGTDSHESNLNYHDVLVDFLADLCRRTDERTYCDTVTRFRAYRTQPPVVAVVSRSVPAGKPTRLRFRLSKIARVNLTLSRGGKVVYTYSAVVGRGTRGVSITPPKKRAKAYAVSLSATDLAGNTAATSRTVKIRRP